MQIHFYATVEAITGIRRGNSELVFTKEVKPVGAVHVSFNIEDYDIQQLTDYEFLIERKG